MGQPNGSMTTGARPTRQRKRKEVEVVDEATDRAQKRMVSQTSARKNGNWRRLCGFMTGETRETLRP